jgi:hypothetical protein
VAKDRSCVRCSPLIFFWLPHSFTHGKIMYCDERECRLPSESEGTVTTKSFTNTFVAPALAESCEKCGKGSLKYSRPFEEQLYPVLQVFREFCLVKQ